MIIRKPLDIIFFSPLSWEEMLENGYRKTSGAMFKALWENQNIAHILLVQFDHRWGFHLHRRVIDKKVEVIGLPIGLPLERFTPVRYINRVLQAWYLSHFLRLGRQMKSIVYWFYDWWPMELVRFLPDGIRVMEITDSVKQFIAQKTSLLKRLETIRQKAFQSIDLNIAVTPTLAREVQGARGITRVYPNGISSDFLQLALIPQKEPAELQELLHPRLCVIGTGWSLNYRTDHELLHAFLRLQPDWHLVLIGCEYIQSPGLTSLLKNKNVTAINLVPRDRLIAYIQHCDVCAVPYLHGGQHQSTGGAIKTLDYLSCQKPVVTTIPEENPLLQPYIHFAPDSFLFASVCQEIVSSKNKMDLEKLNITLQEITWGRRAEQCLETIYALSSEKII